MAMDRRGFLQSSSIWLGLAGGASSWLAHLPNGMRDVSEVSRVPVTHSITPVVADGKWIWREPPTDERGYLDPRDFDVVVGMDVESRGMALDFRATTVAPIGFAEQEIVEQSIETVGCEAAVFPLTAESAQFRMAADRVMPHQRLTAEARFRIRLRRDCRGFDREQFPRGQEIEGVFDPVWLDASPGISISGTRLKRKLQQLDVGSRHPWDQAHAFYEWVWENIEGVPGAYTGVEEALAAGRGDCEERATVFIAMCRAAGIPARQVWVPGHAWAEIGLVDEAGKGHWLPVHTAAYNWFGWTGVHELVLQKGDNLRPPARRRPLRLIDDWYQARGAKPSVTFRLELKPVITAGEEGGPGARRKLADGRWELLSQHVANRGT